ncbi:F0F1 ATP synthase subunit gamma [Euzebya tangerina]|uniref:F0F1 ATP synthase subunit gamma n=1 Tax=Euzebya tangerina TaxID=591198 RepID=UPI000E30C9F0|nr:F0F1 ATP synthase subunit gamma [Euzebya tangerina]
MPGAAELRTLRRRIKTVKSTQKITRAMELIAASRIAKARQAVESARPYAEGVSRVIKDLAAVGSISGHPVLEDREVIKTVAVIVITSDRGLAGAYNTNALRMAERLVEREEQQGRTVEVHAVGKKGEGYFRYRQRPPVTTWEGVTDKPSYADARAVAEPIVQRFIERGVDSVYMVYTDFKSALNQVPSTVQILPVNARMFEGGEGFAPEFMIEPEPDQLLNALVPKYVEHQVFAGLLESAASEHASRQRAMKAATDNAGDVLDRLTIQANQARQAAITTEISEIVGGAEALSNG